MITKKRLGFISFLLVALFSVSFASAVTQDFYTVFGEDRTSGIDYLNSWDINELRLSDNSDYDTAGDWESSWGELVAFTFNPGFSTNEIIDSASIRLEWNAESRINAARWRIVYENGTASSWTNFGSVRYSEGTDTLDISSLINNFDDLNNIIFQFQATRTSTGSGGRTTGFDLAILRVDYTPASGGDSGNLGPVASGSIATPNPSVGDFKISALCDDSATGDQDIQSAEVYITSTDSMSAVDGTFDEVTESVEKTFTGFSEGNYVALVRCQDSEGVWGAYDSVAFSVSLGDTTAPICSVDKLGSYYLINPTTYINSEGYYTTYGSANDSGSGFVTSSYPVSANRTSPGTTNIWTWDNANDVSPNPNWNNVEWYHDFTTSGGRNDYYVNGNHQICCKAVDSAGNTFTGACKNICVDNQVPTVTNVGDDTEDCDEVGRYSNQQSITWTWTGSDVGCAGIDYYNISLYQDSILVYSEIVDSAQITLNNDQLIDGHSYYIIVTPVDNAGNVGVSQASPSINIDRTNPSVIINSPSNGQWFNTNFVINESDSDTNLLACYYDIDSSVGIAPASPVNPWTSTPCNELINVNLDSYCALGNLCTLDVSKKAKDKACNEGTNSVEVYVDRQAPVTTKIVGEPKVSPWGQWIETLTNGWFVTDDTTFTLTCDDHGGVGCNKTYYKVNNGSWIEYLSPFTLSLDGIYAIDYYSTDLSGNIEVIKSEIDKVDTIAPVTTKTIGNPKYNGTYFITNHTPMVLTGVDSEVGCANTYYEIYNRTLLIREGQSEVCNLNVNWTGLSDELYTLSFYSKDYLGNEEYYTDQNHFLDNTAPFIWIWNPSVLEASAVRRCSLSVVTEVSDFGSGVDFSSVIADIKNSTGDILRHSNLSNYPNGGNFYSSVIDLVGVPSGIYTLEITAEDNLGNKRVETRQINLASGVYVEYLSPPQCNVSVSLGGNCLFTFNTCVRDSSSISMWMEKLNNGTIDPFMINARITKDLRIANVGLLQEGIRVSSANKLNLTSLNCQNVNGRTSFDLIFDITPEVAAMIGPDPYRFGYELASYSC